MKFTMTARTLADTAIASTQQNEVSKILIDGKRKLRIEISHRLSVTVLLAGCGQESKPAAVLHLAPITPGAIPEKIGGCGEGCKKLDKFAKWQPLLAPLVEMHRRQEKCSSVEYAMPDTDSDPVDPKFYVQCKEVRSGQLYNTFYTRTQIEMGTPATSDPVSRAYAEPRCAGQLAEKLPGATIANQGFYEAPNGSVRLTYDLKLNGVDKKAACLASHESVEFNVVR